MLFRKKDYYSQTNLNLEQLMAESAVSADKTIIVERVLKCLRFEETTTPDAKSKTSQLGK